MGKIRKEDIDIKVITGFWNGLSPTMKRVSIAYLEGKPLKEGFLEFKRLENREDVVDLILAMTGAPGWPTVRETLPKSSFSRQALISKARKLLGEAYTFLFEYPEGYERKN